MTYETDRCLIRPFEEQDIDAFISYRNDMDWMRYQSFKGLSKDEYRRALLTEFSLMDGVQLAVICKHTHSLIGDLYIKQEGSSYWIGYTISSVHARQGYAYEVVAATIAFLKTKGAICIKAGVEPENTPSIALLNKLNFVYDSTDSGEQIFTLSLIK